MHENSNVSYGVELENFNERMGQLEQGKTINPFKELFLQDSVDAHNRVLAKNVAALSPELRDARAAAIARSL